MKILSSALSKTDIFLFDKQNEAGGILGSSDGYIIDCVFCDNGKEHSKIKYVPDVSKLNSVLKRWVDSGILFKGFFHSHLYGVEELSDEDVFYISKIAETVSASNFPLYFPLYVLPDRKFVVYEKTNKTSALKKTEIFII